MRHGNGGRVAATHVQCGVKSIRLIHWNAAEAVACAARLRAAGYAVDARPLDGPSALRALREQPPAAVVIDLTRQPSHGRDVALALRQAKRTRQVPLIFAEGEPEKVARIRALLPEAVYTSWRRIRGALRRVIAHPPVVTAVPPSLLAGYSGTPLPKKLGLKPNAVVVLQDAPDGFETTLGPLPAGATLLRQADGPRDLTLWFTRSRQDLARCVETMARVIDKGGLWIAWPKKQSGTASDVSQAVVRQEGLAAGLVDYKICAIDAIWSGLKFARRKAS
ncbi:MAG: DUF3052 family protein [Verrucomicrobia bacterium]|nr:DUF3052 family protein [Verrucomicrobiota bacterium]